MKITLISRLLSVVCMTFIFSFSTKAQTSAPNPPIAASTQSSSAAYQLDGNVVPYILPEYVSSGSVEHVWVFAEHIHSIWKMKSKEQITVTSKIDKIDHSSSWMEGTIIGTYSEEGTEGFGVCSCPSKSVRVIGKLTIQFWELPSVSKTFAGMRTFTHSKYAPTQE